jgi:hypothetical protein
MEAEIKSEHSKESNCKAGWVGSEHDTGEIPAGVIVHKIKSQHNKESNIKTGEVVWTHQWELWESVLKYIWEQGELVSARHWRSITDTWEQIITTTEDTHGHYCWIWGVLKLYLDT